MSDYYFAHVAYVDYGCIIGASFLDFKRAFDLVNHSNKLEQFMTLSWHGLGTISRVARSLCVIMENYHLFVMLGWAYPRVRFWDPCFCWFYQ